MTTRRFVLVGVLLLTGCASGGLVPEGSSFAAADFRAAAAEGKAARDRGDLHAADRWPECYAEIADRLEAATVARGDEATTPGLAVLSMRAHIARAKTSRPISAECAQVVLELEKAGLKLAASLMPGGAGALGVLRSLPIGR